MMYSVSRIHMRCLYICMFHFLTSYTVQTAHEEMCHRSPTTVLYVTSAKRTQSERYKVYPNGIIWTTEHNGDTLLVHFGRLNLSDQEHIDTYDGRNKNGEMLLRIEKKHTKLKRPPEVSDVRPSIFIDYNWRGNGTAFIVECKSKEADWKPILYGVIVLVSGAAVVLLGRRVYVRCSYKFKKAPPPNRRTSSERSSVELDEHAPSAGPPRNEEELPNSRTSPSATTTDNSRARSETLPAIDEDMPTPSGKPPSYWDVIDKGERYYPRTRNIEEDESLLPPYPGLPVRFQWE